MSNRLFKVDLSDGARDFKPTATEPGLAMLDRNNANYAILRRWLGDYVAEPEWMGQDVNFYARDEAHGRLENVHCTPCTKADLLGPLQPQLEEIDQKLRKAKPETANEQLVQRIVRKQFAELTKDYDSSDFHCFFFKYRQGSEPPRLVWCWGYQRTDVEPARSIICGNGECEALYTRRPKQKARCPVCSSAAARGRKPPPPLWMRVAQIALLLLLLLGGAIFLAVLAANRPRLVVTPGDWSGPPGSRVQYKVEHKRWLLWNDDVTDKVVPQSHDKRIVRFEPYGAQAKARAPGNAAVTFRFKNLSSDATVSVGQPLQPASVKLVAADDESQKKVDEVQLAVGSTKQLKLIGYYKKEDELDPVDLSELAEWTAEKPDVVLVRHGKLEGASENVSDLAVQYRANEKEPWLPTSAKVYVTKVDYKAIELAVSPETIAMGQNGSIEVYGVDDKGTKYSLLGSSLLSLSVSPQSVAKVKGDYLQAISKGEAKLNAKLLDLNAEASFDVGDSLLAAGTFAVMPSKVTMLVGEYLDLDIVSASTEPISTTSGDDSVVRVVDTRQIAARSPGTAVVTVKQGGKSQTVAVTVLKSNLLTLHIEPRVISVYTGDVASFRVYALDKSGTQIDVLPERLTWVKQPPLEYADFNRDTLQLFGVSQSDGQAWPLVAQLGTNDQIQAEGRVRVVDNTPASTTVIIKDEDQFIPYPPVSIIGRRGYVLRTGVGTEGDLMFRDGSIIVGDNLREGSWFRASNVPSGARIVRIGKTDVSKFSEKELRVFLEKNPLLRGERIVYDVDGALTPIKLGETGVQPFQEVRLLGVDSENMTKSDFSAVLDLDLRKAGQYRITDASGADLTPWQDLGPTPLTTLVTSKIARNEKDSYELFVERKIDDTVDRYGIKFILKPELQ